MLAEYFPGISSVGHTSIHFWWIFQPAMLDYSPGNHISRGKRNITLKIAQRMRICDRSQEGIGMNFRPEAPRHQIKLVRLSSLNASNRWRFRGTSREHGRIYLFGNNQNYINIHRNTNTKAMVFL